MSIPLKIKYEEWYDTGKYFESNKYGKLPYHDAKGEVHEWGYEARQMWDGWNYVMPVLKRLFHPKKILDVGCGCGSFVAYARRHRLDAVGVDVSHWAVEHPLEGAEGYLFWANVAEEGIPYSDQSFDFLFNSDFLEHIYVEDLDFTLNEMCRISSRWIFSIIGGVPDENASEAFYQIKKGEEIPRHLEMHGVSGHVNQQARPYWLKKLGSLKGWKINFDREKRFRKFVPHAVQANWFNIIVLEKV